MTKTLVKYAMCALIAILTVGEVVGASMAPVNPAFLQWQKRRKIKKPDGSQTNVQVRARLLSSMTATDEDEKLDFGLIPEPFDSSYLANLNTGLDCGVQDAMPSKYDLRTIGCLTPVKNQGSYGTCWAHATLGAVESSIKREEGTIYDFSENNMANLHGWDWGFDDGGNATISTAYLLRWSGPVLESDDPYPNPGESVDGTPVRHVQNVRWIPGRTHYLDLDNIKNALMECGALHVSYYHSDFYYNSDKASYYKFADDGSRRTNHAVTLVGWDDDYPASNFKTQPPGDGAFIVRNSWGRYWGDDGYFYVSYYDESFAWKTLYGFSPAESVGNYDQIYQYDPLGMFTSVGYGSSTAWGAAIFSASSASRVAAVGFYALTPSTTYNIYVYTGCTASSPRSGNLCCEQSGKTDNAGFATIPILNPPSVARGARFSIVIKLTTPGYKYPLAFEYAVSGYTSAASASEGQTFLSGNGTLWQDFVQCAGSASFCCKAYMQSAVVVKTLSSVSISGVSSVKSGTTAAFTCKAKYSDGSEKSITPIWSVTSGGAYASISSSGVVTANKVTDQQTVKIQASYTDADITKTDSWSFYVTVAPPEAPTGLTATEGDESSCVRLLWPAVEGATSYAVYRGTTASSGNARFLGDVTAAKYADIDAVPGVKYYYFVKAKNSSGSSAHSAGAQGWRALSAPADVAASDGTSLDYVEVTWAASEGAKYYRVYRSAEEGGTLSALGSWQTDTGYRDETAEPGIVYYYYVAAAVDSRGNMASGYSIFDDGFRKTPTRLSSIAIDGAVSIASGESATYSCTATMTDGTAKQVTPTFSLASGSSYATLSGSRLTAKTVTANQTVTLSASYTEDGITKSATKPVTVTAVKPSAPTGLHVKSQTASGGIVLGWTAVPGAESYKIYRAAGDTAAAVCGMSASVTFADSSAIPGVSYVYWVSAVNSAGESALSAASVSGIIPLAAPAGVTASSARTDGVAATWGAVAGATHYRVSRATSATGAKTDLGAWQTGTTYLDASAVAGTKYWYFVRAATSSAGANASAYSTGAQGVRKVAVTLSSIAIGGGAETVAAGGSLVFSCTATYSDGTTRAVTPTWSVSPASAAVIDANGAFKAGNVTVDTEVMVTARYTDGTTRTVTKSVTVIAPAPAKPTVSVSGISAKPRWPFVGLVDVDYTVSVSPEGTKAAVSVSGYDHDHNVPLAARTLTGEGASAPVEAGRRRITWNVAADYPGFHAAAFSVTVEVAIASIAAPSGLTASQGTSTDHVSLTWDAVTGADSYEIWRGTTTDSANAEQIGTSETGSYTDDDATPGTAYYYWVKSVASYGTSDFAAETICGFVMVKAPASGSATQGTSTTQITLTWSAVVGATSYEIWRGTSNSSSSATKIGSSAATSYSDTTAVPGKTYYYWIKAVSAVGTGAFSSGISGSRLVSAPANVSATDGTSTANVTVTWSAVTGATSYEIWRGTSSSSSSATKIGTSTSTSYSDTSATPVTTYYYWVKAVASAGTSAFSSSDSGYRMLAAPTNVSATDGTSTANVTITWSAVAGATSYEIWRGTSNDSSSATKIGTQAASGYTDIPPSAGVAYYYWVKAVSPSGISDFSASNVGSRSLCSVETVDGVEYQFKVINGKARIENHTSSFSSAIPSTTKGSLSIPSTLGGWSVTSIGSSAFRDCGSLTSVTIPSSVTSIGGYAFSYCSSLTSVTIPSSVTSIGSSAFRDCGSLTSVTIPSSVTSIGGYAFSYCSSLTSVTIPSSVTSIGYSAFSDCSSLTSVTILSGVTSIGDYAFSHCSSLTSVTIPGSVTSIGSYAFMNCSSLTSVTIPSSVTSIGDYAFSHCSSLTSVTIPSSVTSIGKCAFNDCSSLMEINVPSDNKNYMSKNGLLLTKDGKTLVAGVNGAVTIPDSVTSIGSSAFYGCRSLTSVTIPSSVTSIGLLAFSNCSSLMEINVSSDNKNYMSKNGLLLTKDGKTLIAGVNGAVTIPDSVTSIGSYAFFHCSSLTSVTILSGVTSIEASAFSYCSSLTSVTIPSSVTSIGEHAFRDCSSLTSVTIPSSVTSIGYYAFSDCSSLTSVTIPSSVTSIGGRAFNDCSSLTSVTILNGVTSIGDYAFNDCSSLTSVTIPGSVTSIGSYAFCGCSSLTSVTIPSSVTSIGDSAFLGCSSLTSVTIPSSVTSIGVHAFYGCSSLTSVTIPSSVTSIGYSAFSFCSKLSTVYLGESSPFTESDLRGYGVGASVKIVRFYHDKVQLWEDGPYWATTNIGAENPEDYGYYFWWGDTVGYKRENDKWVASDGSNSNFSFTESNTPTYNKDNTTLQSEGWITADGVLAPAHDAAKKHWGGDWRMPTYQEISDLNNNCDWTWTTQNGVNGYVVRGRGDYSANSIFLPCAGYGNGTSLDYSGLYGCYWSSVPYSSYGYGGSRNSAWNLYLYSSFHYTGGYYYRYNGQSVRPLQGFTK